MRGVDQLRHGDGVRLLPDEQRADVGGAVAAVGRGHLGPARAGVALLLGLFAGGGEDRVVPAEAALQQRGAAPGREVRGVPVVHFQVELAVPAIAGESGLLRRHGAGALDGGEVLGEDDAALQFAGARIGRGGEIDGGAGVPEGGPVFVGGGKGGGGVGGGVCRRRVKAQVKARRSVAGVRTKRCGGFLLDRGAACRATRC